MAGIGKTGEDSKRRCLPDEPRVTVVIPCYNSAGFIERTLLSALGQTYRNLDVLVVNDGSTDGTMDILERLGRRFGNLRVVSIPNGGVANARNVGTEMTDSELVAYLDADDLWHPAKIEKQVAAILRHRDDPDWAANYVLFRSIDETDLVILDGPSHTARGAIFGSHLVVNHVGNGSSLLVRREAALSVGGFDPSYAAAGMGGCEDLDFQLRILSRYKMDVVREFLLGYRRHSGSMSSNRTGIGLGVLAVTERFLADARVSDELRDLARESARTYAFSRFVRGRNWPLAWESFRILFRLAPLRTLRFFLSEIYGKLCLRARRLAARIPGQREALGARPFHAYDPLEGLAPDPAPRPLVKRLQRIDAEIQARSPVGSTEQG